MEKKIEDAFKSELPYLGKGLLFIGLCIFAYLAGIVSYDVLSGKEVNYFTEIRNQFEERIAQNPVKPLPVAKPTPRPEGFPEPTNNPQSDATRTITNSQGYELRQPNEEYSQFSNLFVDDEAVSAIGDFELSVPKVVDFWYDSPSKILYTIETKDVPASHQEGINNQLYIAYNLSGNTPVPIKVLYNNIPGIWSRTEILDFTEGKLILKTFGGDGCYGGGSIWTLSEYENNTLVELGAGCGNPEAPRYAGYYNSKIYLYDVEGEFDQYILQDLYTEDVITQQKDTFLPKENFPKDTGYIYQPDKSNILLFGGYTDGSSVYSYDLNTRQFIDK